jgi:hypothetical protein
MEIMAIAAAGMHSGLHPGVKAAWKCRPSPWAKVSLALLLQCRRDRG